MKYLHWYDYCFDVRRIPAVLAEAMFVQTQQETLWVSERASVLIKQSASVFY